MCRIGPHLLPLSVFVLLPSTFILTYVIAVLLKHTELEFPYISDTGTTSPESCIFGQLLNIAAVLIGICIYVRYRQVVEYVNYGSRLVLTLNKVSLWLGLLAALGVSVVGNFQETNVFVVHNIGSLMAFGLGLIYAWIHTVMTFKMHPHINGIIIFHLRWILTLVSTVCLVLNIVFDALATSKFHGKNRVDWHKTDGGFTEHVVSTISEWVMALSYMFYFLTYTHEFQKLSISAPQVHLHIEELTFSGSHQNSHSEADDIIS